MTAWLLILSFYFLVAYYGEHGIIFSDKAGRQVLPFISERRLAVGSALLVTVHISRRKCTVLTTREQSIFIRQYMISAITMLN